jgi:CIC family chloride channel protein
VTRPTLASLSQLRLREHQLFLALTLVAGILGGLAAVLFSVAIDWTTRAFFGLDPSAGRLFLIPVAVSLVTGVLLVRVFPDVRGSGVPQTKTAVHLHGGVIPARVPIGKFLIGVLTIASGHSMGREGPSVQIGAGIASAVGRWLRLPPARVRALVSVGATGALAAAFNKPVSSVQFNLE